MILKKYEDFINRVNKLGFMAFSPILPGFPSLPEETEPGQWHTGDPETDPWRWKDRAAEEKKLAFGCVLGGHKGFISEKMYPYFYAACHPEEEMEERWDAGQINQTVWQLWQIFEQGVVPDTGEIRKLMGVTKKHGASKIDNAVKELEKDFYITVSGNRRKVSRLGEAYGWAANTYEKVTDWASEAWLGGGLRIIRRDAINHILDAGVSIGTHINHADLARALKLQTEPVLNQI